MKLSRNKSILFICLSFSVFVTVLLLMQLSVIGLDQNSVDGRGIFDARLTYYDKDFFYETVAMMSNADFQDYRIFHILDMVFALSYFSSMAIITIPLLSKKFKFMGILIPAIPAFFDIWENISIQVLLSLYPKEVVYANIVGIITCIKWYTGFAWFVFFLVLLFLKVCGLINKAKVNKKP